MSAHLKETVHNAIKEQARILRDFGGKEDRQIAEGIEFLLEQDLKNRNKHLAKKKRQVKPTA